MNVLRSISVTPTTIELLGQVAARVLPTLAYENRKTDAVSKFTLRELQRDQHDSRVQRAGDGGTQIGGWVSVK